MRMQVILDSSFRLPGLSPIWGRGDKGEFRNWTKLIKESVIVTLPIISAVFTYFQLSF